jgi:hypothetical protein
MYNINTRGSRSIFLPDLKISGGIIGCVRQKKVGITQISHQHTNPSPNDKSNGHQEEQICDKIKDAKPHDWEENAYTLSTRYLFDIHIWRHLTHKTFAMQ